MTDLARRSVVVVAVLSAAVATPAVASASCPPFVPPASAEAAARMLAPGGFVATPRSGRAPLLIRMVWMIVPVADPVLFEIDADGDGQPEWSDTSVTDRTGHVVTSTIPVEVVSAAAFDADVSGRWATFKAALARGELSQALECVTLDTRDRARQALGPGSRHVPSLLPHADTLTFLRKASSVDLEYHTDFVKGRAPTLVFSPDIDGVWRIDAGGWLP
jgi:hypothetical protein